MLVDSTMLSSLFGVPVGDCSAFTCTTIEGVDRDQLLLDCLTAMERSGSSGIHRLPDWEQGWTENLRAFRRSRSLADLRPGYYRSGVPFRLMGQFVRSSVEDAVWRISSQLRSSLFERWLKAASSVHEFGCGTGHHLFWMAQRDGGKHYIGYDWATASQEIVRNVASDTGLPVAGRHFDLFAPDETLDMGPGAAVLTFGALEQLGDQHAQFLRFLLAAKPAIVVNVEPLYELYDAGVLLDYLALRYHERRNYLRGYLPALKELQAEGKIEIRCVQRVMFGSLYNDTHSYVVWGPK